MRRSLAGWILSWRANAHSLERTVKCYEHLTGFSSAKARGGFPLAATLRMECAAPLACHDVKGAARPSFERLAGHNRVALCIV